MRDIKEVHMQIQPQKLNEDFFNLAKSFGLTKEETERFYTQLGRVPSKEELAVCGALWSEHCSYKSSRVHLKRFHTQESWVLQGPGENAGVVAITKDYGIAFKMESHNHPSYIEPYQGAATGVGGILRDVFCMGAKPIANLNCLRYGEGAWNAVLIRDSVRGIGDYGNSVGIPTITGDTSFHFNYSQNILVNAFTAGIIHKDKIFKGILSDEKSNKNEDLIQKTKTLLETIFPSNHVNQSLNEIIFPENENILVYFGSATGRDGVHGATMSSNEFNLQGSILKPTVQVGDPFAEKILIEATLTLIEKKLTVGLQDMGAAGLTSSSVEMADRSSCGVGINLNLIPQRASNMQAWEILLSESQERMICAVHPNKLEEVLNTLKHFDLSYAVIGRVNHTGRFVCTFDNTIVTATPVDLLVKEVPRYQWPLQDREDYLKSHTVILNEAKESFQTTKNNPDTHNKKILALNFSNENAHNDIQSGINLISFIEKYRNYFSELFSHPCYASRAPLFHHYCSTVQAETVAGCGALQNAAAGIVRLPNYAQEIASNGLSTQIGLAVAGGCEERLVELNPFQGSVLATLKIARKIIATGATPLALTDCLNFGSPKSPEVMRQFSDAVDGINLVARELKIPVVSGNVSLNNQTAGRPIPPTPMIGMIGRVNDVRYVPLSECVPRYFSRTQTKTVYLVHVATKNWCENSNYECSQTAWIIANSNSSCPNFDLSAEKQLWQCLQAQIQEKKPLLSFPVGHGGLLGAISICALKSNAELQLEESLWQEKTKDLLAEGNVGFVLGFTSQNIADLFIQEVFLNKQLVARSVASLSVSSNSLQKTIFDLSATRQAYENGLQSFFLKHH